MTRSLSAWIGLFGRGVAMGVAEVVPGVSGGTIAFVSGIYDELLATLAGLSRQSPLDFFRSPTSYWVERNLNFLVVLALGMGFGIVAFAHLLRLALENMAPVVWAFFFGLILASVWHIGRERPLKVMLTFGLLGLVMGLALTQLPQLSTQPQLWMFFVGGVVAVSAWLLPAVSGSFMLLAVGLYAPVLAAVSDFDWPILATLAAGCATGLLLFSRLLTWVLARFRHQVLGLLTGFMLGALANLWPWRLEGDWLSPQGFALAGGDPLVVGCLIAVVLGVGALLALVRLDR